MTCDLVDTLFAGFHYIYDRLFGDPTGGIQYGVATAGLGYAAQLPVEGHGAHATCPQIHTDDKTFLHGHLFPSSA
jgi:hypothetical protein